MAAVLDAWTDAFAAALASAQQQGYMRADAEPRRIAAFLVAAIEGSSASPRTP